MAIYAVYQFDLRRGAWTGRKFWVDGKTARKAADVAVMTLNEHQPGHWSVGRSGKTLVARTGDLSWSVVPADKTPKGYPFGNASRTSRARWFLHRKPNDRLAVRRSTAAGKRSGHMGPFPTKQGAHDFAARWNAAHYGDALTERRARIIRESETRFEQARKAHDPKRYKRGGGYGPEEYKAIAHKAGLSRAPSNRALENLQYHEFLTDPPETIFAYYTNDMKHVTLWGSKKIGTIVWKGPVQQRGFGYGGKVQAIRMRGINGIMYAGLCNLSGGTYCRLKRMKTVSRVSPYKIK